MISCVMPRRMNSLKYIFLINLIALPALFASVTKEDLECRQDDSGTFRIFNKVSSIYIGTSGSSGLSRCQEYLKTLRNDLVCSYTTERNFRPFHASKGHNFGKTTGSDSLSRCQEYIETSSKNLVCKYEGTDSFKVFRINDGNIMGGGNGSSSLGRCKEYIQTERAGVYCQYDQKVKGENHYLSYRIKDNKVLGFPMGTYASSMEECDQHITNLELGSEGEFRDIEDEKSEVKEIFVREFAPLTKEVARDVYFYSYYSKGELGLSSSGDLDLKDQSLVESLETWRSSFNEFVPFEKGWLGYGLYGAINPVDSQAYASGDWVLTETKVPKGSRYYDMRINYEKSEYNYAFHFTNRARRSLGDICKISDEAFNKIKFKINGERYFNHINKVDLTKNRICHEALVEAFQELKIDFVSYHWYYVGQKNIRDRNACGKENTAAVIFTSGLGPERFPMKFLGKKGNEDFKNEYQRMYQLARLYSNDPKASWPQYKDKDAPLIDEEEELSHQFDCREAYPEDAPHL